MRWSRRGSGHGGHDQFFADPLGLGGNSFRLTAFALASQAANGSFANSDAPDLFVEDATITAANDDVCAAIFTNRNIGRGNYS